MRVAAAAQSPFRISVISDEISQDFDHACSVIANDFGLQWVELREMWGKNLQASSDAEIAEAQKILQSARNEVDNRLKRARHELTEYAGELATQRAAQILREKVNDSDRERLFDESVREVAEARS